MKRLTPTDIDNIAESYINLIRMTKIAAHYGLSRQRIWQVLQDAGVDTSKKLGGISIVCNNCGTTFKKPKCQVRKRLHCFCSNDCYYDWLAEKSAQKQKQKECQIGEKYNV